MNVKQETIHAVEQGLRTTPVFLQDKPETPASLSERMAYHNVPGVSIAVIDNNAIAWTNGYGVADVESCAAVINTTRFSAMSISKPVTALAVLRLVQHGVLDLDTDINHYLQQWRVPENEPTQTTKVTLRTILSHTAGLDAGYYYGYAPDEPMPTLMQLLKGEPPSNSDPVQVITVPGTRYVYSGAGYWVLQQLIKEITGESFAVAMRKLVLEPLEMEQSAFVAPNETAASAHDGDGGVLFDKFTRHPGQADGGLWTTPIDLARYALAIMAAYRGAADPILTQSLAQAMLTRQAGFHGLGPMVIGMGDDLQFSHGGAGEGFLCQMVAFPRRGQGTVIMTNGANGWPLIQEVLRSLATAYQWPSYQPIGRTHAAIEPTELAACAGTYKVISDPLTLDRFAEYTGQWQIRDGRFIGYTVQAADNHLVVRYPNDHVLTFYPESDETFFSVENETTLRFQPTTDGSVNTLEVVVYNELRLQAQRI